MRFLSIWEKNSESENASKNVYDRRYPIIFHLAVYSIACDAHKCFWLISTIRRFDFSQIFLHFRDLDYLSLKKNTFFKDIAQPSILQAKGGICTPGRNLQKFYDI
jgi:hypothetical protein